MLQKAEERESALKESEERLKQLHRERSGFAERTQLLQKQLNTLNDEKREFERRATFAEKELEALKKRLDKVLFCPSHPLSVMSSLTSSK